MTDDGERIAKLEVRVDTLEKGHSVLRKAVDALWKALHEGLDGLRSDRNKILVAALFFLATTIVTLLKGVVF